MKKLRISDLDRPAGARHVLEGLIPGDHLTQGGLNFKKPGQRSHPAGCTCAACDGRGRHVHAGDYEVFVILQGQARMEVDGVAHPLVAGDVVICEPGEDHHLVADETDPCVNIFLHAGSGS